MLPRRSFMHLGFGLAAGLAVPRVFADSACGPQSCRAQVNIPKLIAAINVQECPEWCWAASISMIFAFYGHPTDQKKIVAQTYGDVVCFPAGATKTIAVDLSREWEDDDGDAFKSTIVGVYDPANQAVNLDNASLIEELANDHPLLTCNATHAMVVYAASYAPTLGEPYIGEIDVVDPWPASPRTHPLNAMDSRASISGGSMTFLATVRVED